MAVSVGATLGVLVALTMLVNLHEHAVHQPVHEPSDDLAQQCGLAVHHAAVCVLAPHHDQGFASAESAASLSSVQQAEYDLHWE